MGRMPFLLPLVFPVRAPPKTELSETTKKIYKGKLNNLAKQEIGRASCRERV